MVDLKTVITVAPELRSNKGQILMIYNNNYSSEAVLMFLHLVKFILPLAVFIFLGPQRTLLESKVKSNIHELQKETYSILKYLLCITVLPYFQHLQFQNFSYLVSSLVFKVLTYKLIFDYSELFKNTEILAAFQVKNQLKLTSILVFLRSSW